jgi:hypothetical protein
MLHFLSSPTNAPLDHAELVDEHVHRKFHNVVEEKFRTLLAPCDHLGRESPPSHMDHHALNLRAHSRLSCCA